MLCGPRESSRNKARDVNTLHTALRVSLCGCPGLVVTLGSSDLLLWEGPMLEKLRHVPPGSMPNLSLFGKPQNGWGKTPVSFHSVVGYEDSQCPPPWLCFSYDHRHVPWPLNSSNFSSENEVQGPLIRAVVSMNCKNSWDRYLQKMCSRHLGSAPQWMRSVDKQCLFLCSFLEPLVQLLPLSEPQHGSCQKRQVDSQSSSCSSDGAQFYD